MLFQWAPESAHCCLMLDNTSLGSFQHIHPLDSSAKHTQLSHLHFIYCVLWENLRLCLLQLKKMEARNELLAEMRFTSSSDDLLKSGMQSDLVICCVLYLARTVTRRFMLSAFSDKPISLHAQILLNT